MGFFLHEGALFHCARVLVNSAIYVALAVAGLGVATGTLAGWSWVSSLPVWLLGTFSIYATHHVVLGHWPTRRSRITMGIAIASAVIGMVVLLAWRCDWVAAAGILAALLAGLAYSYGLADVVAPLRALPLVKSLLPWAVAWAALTLLPMHTGGWNADDIPRAAFASLWAGCILLANILWCDLRDLASDQHHRILSIPAALGLRPTRIAIALLCPVACAAGLLAAASPEPIAIAMMGAVGIAALAAIDPRPLRRLTSELIAEGILLLPAAILIMSF